MSDIGDAFLDRSARYLTDDYLPRIRGCLEDLPEEDLWWRPNDSSNSVGNLLLHLAGNLRQWVVAHVGGVEDTRERDAEFEAQEGATAAELLDRLEAVVREAAWTLRRLDAGELLESRTIQGMDVTVMEAVYHAVEHFSMHVGQIIWITKLRTARDLGFYRVDGGVARTTWTVE